MTRGIFSLAFLILAFVGSDAWAESGQDVKGKSPRIQCSGTAGPRQLAIVSKEKGCELQYTKNGTTETLATQKMGQDYCEEKLSKVKGKLEVAGYKCESL